MISKKKALKLYESKFWESMTYKEQAEFQFAAKRMCMPFNLFHKAVEKSLGRPVFTHEFGLNWKGLIKELHREKRKSTFEEVINLIPEDKRVIIVKV